MDKVIAVLRAELGELDEHRSRLLQMLAIAEGTEAKQLTTDPQTRPSRGLSRKTVAVQGAVESALLRRGAPMKLSEILEEVEASGIEVGGKDPSATLGANLRRSDKFQSISGTGWWFRDQEVPTRAAQDVVGGETCSRTSPPTIFERRPVGTEEPIARP